MKKTDIIKTLVKANEIYWSTGENGMPEAEYNRLMAKLQEIDPNHPLITGIGETKIKSAGKVVHDTPMLSLDKAYTVDEVRKWMAKVARTADEEFFVTPKYDGIAARLQDGCLATRGGGDAGENISHFISIMTWKLDPHSDHLERHDGEILITDKTFTEKFVSGKVTRSGGEKYKNSRNAAAGILNNDHVENQWEGVLTFVEHSQYATPAFQSDIDSKIEFVKEIIHDLGLPTDGIVIKVADEKYADSLGHTSHHWKHSIALKHANESEWTVLKGVEFQMAKDHIGMVGILEPVEIEGATIKRVSLHNLDIIKQLELSIGDEVLIERAGAVIPYISEVKQRWGMTQKIECHECPSCHGPVRIDKQFYVCDNPTCEDKVVNKIDSALKDLDSKGIADSTIKKLVRAGHVKNVADMFSLKMMDFIGLEGMGDKSIAKIMNELGRLMESPQKPEAVLAMLNIPGFGKSIFKKLLAEVELRPLVNMLPREFAQLPNMSEIRSLNLYTGIIENQSLLVRLLEIFSIESAKPQPKGEDMITVCFTGKGNTGRAEYEAMCNGTPYVPMGSVSGALQILVCADPSSDSGKMKKARAMGVEVISYNDFERLVS